MAQLAETSAGPDQFRWKMHWFLPHVGRNWPAKDFSKTHRKFHINLFSDAMPSDDRQYLKWKAIYWSADCASKIRLTFFSQRNKCQAAHLRTWRSFPAVS